MDTFQVTGLSCQHCVRAVTGAIQARDPAARVVVDLASGRVEVASTLPREAVAEAIRGEGYEVLAAAGG